MESKFLNTLVERARANKQRIAFPETDAERILQTAEQLVKLDAAIPVLIGDKATIEQFADSIGVSLEGMEFVDNQDEATRAEVVKEYLACCDLLTEKSIARKVKHREGMAAALTKIGRCGCFVSGFQSATAETIFNAQNILGMADGISTVSSLCVLEPPYWTGSEGNLLCITDCVVTQDPDSQALADIAINACDTMKKLMKWEPRAAMLSYSTMGSGRGLDNVQKVVDAVAIANEKRPDLAIEGELQMDAAILPDVAAKKVKTESKVAGKANIVVFPDLNAGNIGVKIANIFGHAPDHGALLAGLARPCVDLSRSATVDRIVGASLMVAVVAAES
jgi:phosphate acetyltransferase